MRIVIVRILSRHTFFSVFSCTIVPVSLNLLGWIPKSFSSHFFNVTRILFRALDTEKNRSVLLGLFYLCSNECKYNSLLGFPTQNRMESERMGKRSLEGINLDKYNHDSVSMKATWNSELHLVFCCIGSRRRSFKLLLSRQPNSIQYC